MNQLQPRSILRQDEPLIGEVMQFVAVMKRLFAEARRPDAPVDVWAPLAELVARDEFRWVNPSYQELDWSGYTAYLNQWACAVTWESTISRVHQWQNIVYLEHIEQCQFGDVAENGRVLSVFEFNNAGKLQRLSIYLQHAPSLGL